MDGIQRADDPHDERNNDGHQCHQGLEHGPDGHHWQAGQPIDGTGVTVALVDTGIDAGHPDLDYKEKVIINLKSDFDGTFTEVEDGDTGSGHGTHCAGTIAGNGDASAEARRGVAPGASLIGISTGEHFLQNVVGALQWVYDHSQPSDNPYNIRVVSNSWGSAAGEYDPNDAVTVVANKMIYENNVVVVFAAGNSGADDHDGSHIETSTYGNTPGIVEVAAAKHDGNGIASFSSRGQADMNQTWPDIAAPGYHIWSTQARKTQITAMTGGMNPEDGTDAYYMSISGTSMATPHVSGAIALLWQACPHLRVTNISENSMNTNATYFQDPTTKITEVEWILEATADYMPMDGDNGIPQNSSISDTHFNHQYDYSQGYGLINMEKAVQVALVLEDLRAKDLTASVFTAYKVVMKNPVWPDGLAHTINVTEPTNTLYTTWQGEWGYLLDQRNSIVTHHERSVSIPNGTTKVVIDLNYNPATSERWAMGQLTVKVDSNQDGSIDWSGQGGYSSHGFKHDEVDVSTIGSAGSIWDFYVTGEYVQAPGRSRPNILNNQYMEVLIEYNLGVKVVLATSADNTTYVPPVDLHAAFAQWEFGDPEGDANGTAGSITMTRNVYNYSRIVLEAPPIKKKVLEAGTPWWLVGLVIAIAAVCVGYYLIKKGIIKTPKLPSAAAMKKVLPTKKAAAEAAKKQEGS